MKYTDQFSDMTLRNIGDLYDQTTRDKLAGVVTISRIRRNAFHPGEMISQLLGTTAHAFPSDSPVMVRVVKISAQPAGSAEDAVMEALMNAHMSEGRGVFKEIGCCPDDPAFRSELGRQLPCVIPEEGMFPVNNPLQALLSFIFAHGQNMPQRLMERFDQPMIRMFGPKTYRKMQTIVDEMPAAQLTDASNIIEAAPEPDDGMPKVQSFLPRLIFELVKLNLSLKGKLDEVLSYVTSLQNDKKQLTTADRDIQRSLMDQITELSGGESELRKRTGGRTAKDLVFNTQFGKDQPEILKVGDFFIDKSKLETLPYQSGAASFSSSVADAIYTRDKKHIDFKALVELIERLNKLLEDPKIEDGEKKEIQDRVLGPLRLFLEPDGNVVDKIVVMQ